MQVDVPKVAYQVVDSIIVVGSRPAVDNGRVGLFPYMPNTTNVRNRGEKKKGDIFANRDILSGIQSVFFFFS